MEKILDKALETKPTKKMMKERFIYTQREFAILDIMVHGKDKYDTIIPDDEILTREIGLFGEAVLRFERETGFLLSIRPK